MTRCFRPAAVAALLSPDAACRIGRETGTCARIGAPDSRLSGAALPPAEGC